MLLGVFSLRNEARRRDCKIYGLKPNVLQLNIHKYVNKGLCIREVIHNIVNIITVSTVRLNT